MAKRIANNVTMTPTATADATNLVDSQYPMAILGGAAGQITNIIEVYLGGQAGASTPTFILLSRDSQFATGSLTKDATLSDAAMIQSTTALASVPTVFSKAATNKPQRDAAQHLLNLSFNAFGGIVRWVAAPGEEISIVGNATASASEASLSAFTGGTAGLMGSHMVFETF